MKLEYTWNGTKNVVNKRISKGKLYLAINNVSVLVSTSDLHAWNVRAISIICFC